MEAIMKHYKKFISHSILILMLGISSTLNAQRTIFSRKEVGVLKIKAKTNLLGAITDYEIGSTGAVFYEDINDDDLSKRFLIDEQGTLRQATPHEEIAIFTYLTQNKSSIIKTITTPNSYSTVQPIEQQEESFSCFCNKQDKVLRIDLLRHIIGINKDGSCFYSNNIGDLWIGIGKINGELHIRRATYKETKTITNYLNSHENCYYEYSLTVQPKKILPSKVIDVKEKMAQLRTKDTAPNRLHIVYNTQQQKLNPMQNQIQSQKATECQICHCPLTEDISCNLPGTLTLSPDTPKIITGTCTHQFHASCILNAIIDKDGNLEEKLFCSDERIPPYFSTAPCPICGNIKSIIDIYEKHKDFLVNRFNYETQMHADIDIKIKNLICEAMEKLTSLQIERCELLTAQLNENIRKNLKTAKSKYYHTQYQQTIIDAIEKWHEKPLTQNTILTITTGEETTHELELPQSTSLTQSMAQKDEKVANTIWLYTLANLIFHAAG